MKICLVTAFPPSTGGLSEYGFHVAQELQRNPFLSLTVLADEISPDRIGSLPDSARPAMLVVRRSRQRIHAF